MLADSLELSDVEDQIRRELKKKKTIFFLIYVKVTRCNAG